MCSKCAPAPPEGLHAPPRKLVQEFQGVFRPVGVFVLATLGQPEPNFKNFRTTPYFFLGIIRVLIIHPREEIMKKLEGWYFMTKSANRSKMGLPRTFILKCLFLTILTYFLTQLMHCIKSSRQCARPKFLFPWQAHNM